MTKHQRETHPAFVEGCFPCQIQTVGVMSMPDGTRPGSAAAAHAIKFKDDVERYRSARQGGIQPARSTKAGVIQEEKRIESALRAIPKLEAWGNDPEDVKKIAKIDGIV